MPEEKPAQVVVTDVQMEFFSMVVFMVKWVLACIPAAIILVCIFVTVSFGLSAIGAVITTLIASLAVALGMSV